MAVTAISDETFAGPEPALHAIRMRSRGSGPVKEIVAVVKPFLAEKVLQALETAPLEACAVREVKGYGRQKSYLDQYGDSEYAIVFLPKIEISLWVDDARVDEVIEQISAVARTGRIGDGKIFVLPVLGMHGV